LPQNEAYLQLFLRNSTGAVKLSQDNSTRYRFTPSCTPVKTGRRYFMRGGPLPIAGIRDLASAWSRIAINSTRGMCQSHRLRLGASYLAGSDEAAAQVFPRAIELIVDALTPNIFAIWLYRWVGARARIVATCSRVSLRGRPRVRRTVCGRPIA
jgi:hypothetical protein